MMKIDRKPLSEDQKGSLELAGAGLFWLAVYACCFAVLMLFACAECLLRREIGRKF